MCWHIEGKYLTEEIYDPEKTCLLEREKQTEMHVKRVFVSVVVLISGVMPTKAVAQDAESYVSDVAPILSQHCAVCHRPGGIGPFSLLDYESARSRASLIADVTRNRVMPPWKPVGPPAIFHAERRLSDDEINIIDSWFTNGAPEGTSSSQAAAVVANDSWQLGSPDLVVTMPEPYALAAGSDDVYRKFVLPVPVESPRWVRAVEIQPRSDGAIHHATIRLDTSGRARDLDADDPQPGYGGFMVESAQFPPGHVLGWSPGKRVTEQQEGLSWELATNVDFVLQLHLLPGAEELNVQPEIGLYFDDGPATLQPVSVILQSMTIDIPPGDPEYVVLDAYRLPVAIDLLAIYPHAHYLGRQMQVTATPPDGMTQTLLRIDDWDFNWQDDYRYREPPHLPAGTRIEMRYVYDNSANNPKNPHSPPEQVVFGPRSTDEMAQLLLQTLPAGEEDRQVLQQSLQLKSARDEILGYQASVRRDPGDYESRTGLAVRYLEVGQLDAATDELREAIRLAPEFSDAHYNLGGVLQSQGSIYQAIAAYRQAIAFDPTYGEAHNNLGTLLENIGDRDNAVAHYRLAIQFQPRQAAAHFNLANALMMGDRDEVVLDEAVAELNRAVELDPNYAEAHNRLGALYVADGQLRTGIAEYRKALTIDPSLVRALVELAWLLATGPESGMRNAVEALELVQRATPLLGEEHPVLLDTLAAVYATNGRFEEAVETARRAAELSRRTPGFEARAALIERRVGSYLAHRPFRMPR